MKTTAVRQEAPTSIQCKGTTLTYTYRFDKAVQDVHQARYLYLYRRPHHRQREQHCAELTSFLGRTQGADHASGVVCSLLSGCGLLCFSLPF